jgi:hypothetical protein
LFYESRRTTGYEGTTYDVLLSRNYAHSAWVPGFAIPYVFLGLLWDYTMAINVYQAPGLEYPPSPFVYAFVCRMPGMVLTTPLWSHFFDNLAVFEFYKRKDQAPRTTRRRFCSFAFGHEECLWFTVNVLKQR